MMDSAATTTFDALFETSFHSGYATTRRLLQSKGAGRDVAEEIAQAAWARGWERREQLRRVDLLGPWVNSIALNLWRSHIHDNRRFDCLEQDITTHSKINDHLDANAILKSCQQSESKILRNFYYDGLSTEEIARHHRCRPVTIRVRLMRLRESLRSRLGLERASGRAGTSRES